MSIQVLYPRGIRSGGPQALHQLVHTARGLGYEATLVATPASRTLERVPEFGHYDAPESSEIVDDPSNVVVSYETNFRPLHRLRRSTRVVWWLSVDNSPAYSAATMWNRRNMLARDAARSARLWWRDLPDRRIYRRLITQSDPPTLHAAQSAYARTVISRVLGKTPFMLTDYTEPLGRQPSVTEKRGVIAYYPARCGREIAAIKHARPDYLFTPIENLSPTQVQETLSRAQVYLDLGHHPGKDRLPREAALAGAVVITSRSGSAAFQEDVPIPEAHKIDLKGHWGDFVEPTTRVLDQVLAHPSDAVAEQDFYRKQIRGEGARFVAEVQQFCERLRC